MNQQRLLAQFKDFLSSYDVTGKDEIWQQQSNTFKLFWNGKVLEDKVKELDDFEVDGIIRFIDRQARGNTPNDEAIAKVMIAQGVWRKMFNQFKSDKNLGQLVDQIMRALDASQTAKLIDQLYKYNEKNRNS